MSATETVVRMLALVPWLLERPGVTVDETARRFDVTPATILSDLDTIGYCGLPGLGGGDLFEISVMRDRILVRMAHELHEPLRLHPREALRLVLVGEAVASALGERLPALRSALDTVRDAVGVPAGVEVELTDDGTTWLAPLRQAIESQRQVELAYRSRGAAKPSRRRLAPWRLHVFEGVWYLQGLDERSGEPRTFRLDRIAELDTLDEEAAPPPDDLETLSARYEPAAGDLEVELHLTPRARWVAEVVRADRIEDLDDGRRRVVFHTDAPSWVTRLVLTAAPGAVVIRPESLAAAVAADARTAAAYYD